MQEHNSSEMLVTDDGLKQTKSMITLTYNGKEHHVQILLVRDSVEHKGDLKRMNR